MIFKYVWLTILFAPNNAYMHIQTKLPPELKYKNNLWTTSASELLSEIQNDHQNHSYYAIYQSGQTVPDR